jgi:putative toxin-antitoxin system antitoxin component (TIGR02293 family)
MPTAVASQPAASLLGGTATLGHPMTDPLETHDLLLRGLPARAIDHLLSHLLVLDKTESLALAMGMSLRTFQRRQDNLSKPLNAEQSGRTWKFAEILAQAIRVFGTQEEAERWLDRPAMGLNGRRPIDLLATPVGVAMVETFLTRLEHGVYT